MINITIDGKAIQVPEGTTVLRAAEMAGISIPTLCDHSHLTPYGGCRLCLVEVEGARTLQPSCTLPSGNNMVVRTDTEKVRSARKFVLTLLFSERNHFCPYCQVSGGDCELQNAALSMEMSHWPLQPNWQPYPMDASHPHIIIDHNRCILCRRCVRACGELAGNFTLGFEERGANSFLVADLGVPLGESSCVSCGTCVQVCPTGAIIERSSAYRGMDAQIEHNRTLCIECSLGCGVDIVSRNNHVVKVNGDWDATVNEGVICEMGRFKSIDDSRERVVTPLVKKNGAQKAATWGEALVSVAGALQPHLQGKNGVAALVSSRLPAEALYLTKAIFAEKFGSSMVASLDEGIPTAAASSLADSDHSAFEGTLASLEKAGCVVIFGTDLLKNHQVAGFMVKRLLTSGAKLVIVETDSNGFEPFADYVLKGKKNTENEIVVGLNAALAQLGKAPATFADLTAIAAKTGISQDDFVAVANLISGSNLPVFVYGEEMTSLNDLVVLAKNSGVITAERSGMVNMRGKANSLAAAQYGFDKAINLDGKQVVYVALGDDEPSQRLVQKLEKVPFLVVQASYISQLTAIADVVLPVENWVEQEGHYLNLEGRLQKANRAVTPKQEIRSNEATLMAVADSLGVKVDGEWKKALTLRTSPVSLVEA